MNFLPFCIFILLTLQAKILQAESLGRHLNLQNPQLIFFESGTNAEINKWKENSKKVQKQSDLKQEKGVKDFGDRILGLQAWKVNCSEDNESGGFKCQSRQADTPDGCKSAVMDFSTQLKFRDSGHVTEITLPDDFSTLMRFSSVPVTHWIIQKLDSKENAYFCVVYQDVKKHIQSIRKNHPALEFWML